MSKQLVVPNPLKDLAPLVYDLEVVSGAEERINEIAVVTPTKAPELLALFSQSCLQLARCLGDLYLQYSFAKRRVSERRAIMIIDVIPEKLKDKKLPQNEMNRQALLDLDEEYSRAILVENQLDAALELIKNRLRLMEGNISAVKKVIGDTSKTYIRYNPNLITGEIQDSEVPGHEESSFFGKPRY